MSGMASAPVRQSGISLGRPLGIPVVLSPTWLIVGAFVTLNVGGLARDELGLGGTGATAVGATCAVLLAASVLLHELGHAAVAVLFDIPIRRITLFVLGGIAEMERDPETPDREWLVALAGPMVSLVLATSSWGVAALVSGAGLVGFVAQSVALTNSGLAVFNLLPGLPLDGGRLVRAAVWRVTGDRVRATRVSVAGGQVLAVLLAGVGAALLLVGDVGGLFVIVLAAFLMLAGRQTLRRTLVTSRVPGLDAGRLARPVLGVRADLPLAEALRRAGESGRRLLVVASDGRPDGVISADAVRSVPDSRRPWVAVGDVTRRLEPGLLLPGSLRGQDLVDAMARTPATEYLVVDPAGEPLGVLSRRDVALRLDGRAPEPA
jgi:Zn-dependent protease